MMIALLCHGKIMNGCTLMTALILQAYMRGRCGNAIVEANAICVTLPTALVILIFVLFTA